MLISISCENEAELRVEMARVAKLFGLQISFLPLASGADPKKKSSPSPSPASAGPARGRGRPFGSTKKTLAEVAAPAPAEDEYVEEPADEPADDLGLAPAPVAAPAPAVATKEQAAAALTALNEKKGLMVAKAVLVQFNVGKFSALPPEAYGEFVKACQVAAK